MDADTILETLKGDEGELSLYLATDEGELVDLEIAAEAAMKWAQALKVAAKALDPEHEYRVGLVETKPGSAKWIARIEQSPANQAAKRVYRGWKKVPLIMRLTVGLAVVVPTTLDPSVKYWSETLGISEDQKAQVESDHRKIANDPSVKVCRQTIYRVAQRDPKITAIGTGVPDREGWRPSILVPANQFAEAEGLFDPQTDDGIAERTVHQTLDVVLVTPRLENARRAWTFRQEGLPGTFNADMSDPRFLAALDQKGIEENLRANIPMTIRLEIKQEFVDDEWRVKRRGRRVVEVISPVVDRASE